MNLEMFQKRTNINIHRILWNCAFSGTILLGWNDQQGTG